MCKSCTKALLALDSNSLSPSPPPNTPAPNQIAAAVLAQCKKRDLTYKTAALECMGDVLEALKVDVFDQLFEDVLSPLFKPVSFSDRATYLQFSH